MPLGKRLLYAEGKPSRLPSNPLEHETGSPGEAALHRRVSAHTFGRFRVECETRILELFDPILRWSTIDVGSRTGGRHKHMAAAAECCHHIGQNLLLHVRDELH